MKILRAVFSTMLRVVEHAAAAEGLPYCIGANSDPDGIAIFPSETDDQVIVVIAHGPAQLIMRLIGAVADQGEDGLLKVVSN